MRTYGDQLAGDFFRQGNPANALFAESVPRWAATADLAVLTTQVMEHVGVPLQAGEVVTNISFVSGATPAGTPTNWFFALYDINGNLLAQTADQLTAAWAADTEKKLALATPQLIVIPGLYYPGIAMKATTPISLQGAPVRASLTPANIGLTGSRRLSGTNGAALVGTAPATISAPAAVAGIPYCVLT